MLHENKILNEIGWESTNCNSLPVAAVVVSWPRFFLANFSPITSSAKKAADGGERAEAEASGGFCCFIVTCLNTAFFLSKKKSQKLEVENSQRFILSVQNVRHDDIPWSQGPYCWWKKSYTSEEVMLWDQKKGRYD